MTNTHPPTTARDRAVAAVIRAVRRSRGDLQLEANIESALAPFIVADRAEAVVVSNHDALLLSVPASRVHEDIPTMQAKERVRRALTGPVEDGEGDG